MAQITATDIARCGGMKDDKRRKWVEKKRLNNGPFKEYDAVETAIVAHLSATLSQKKAPEIWDGVRNSIRALVLAGVEEVWLLVPQIHQDAQVHDEAVTLVSAACGSDAVHLVDLASPIREAKRRFRLLIDEQTAGQVSSMSEGRAQARRS